MATWTPPADLCQGRYRLESVLGEGAMGVVWRGVDGASGGPVAVKFLSPGLTRFAEMRERFRREARVLAELAHPGIVGLLDFGEEGDQAYLVMELIEGGSFQSWVQAHGPMPSRMAVGAIAQVCAALAAAHDAGIIHRDIKPQNLLVDRAGRCRVVDFGIARFEQEIARLTRTNIRMGSLGYMAPEQQRSARDVDHTADIYAVGATLLFLLTGDTPIDMDRSLEVHGPRLQPDLAHVIMRATLSSPQHRYSAVTRLRGVLDRVREGLPETPEGTPTLYQPPRPVMVHPTGPTLVLDGD